MTHLLKQTRKERYVAAPGGGCAGVEWEARISRMSAVIYRMDRQGPTVYSTENYIQYPLINHNGNYQKRMFKYKNQFAA